MSRDMASKLARATVARTAPATEAPPKAPDSTTTTTTVQMSKHLRAELDTRFIELRRDTGLPAKRLGIGPVSVALYEAFLADPDLQREVIRRLT